MLSQRKIGVALVALAAWGVGLSVMGAPPSLAPMETAAFNGCIASALSQTRQQRTAPERAQIILAGVCAAEEMTMMKAVEADLMRMDAGGLSYADKKEITAGTMSSLRSVQNKMMLKYIGDYTLWYETTK
jgi:hypothetical protein